TWHQSEGSVAMALTSTTLDLVVRLADATEAAVGAKARNLARLSALGFAVPPAVVLTDSSFRRFLDFGDLHGPIASLTDSLEGKSVTAVQCAAETIAALLLESPFPIEIRSALDNEVVSLLPGPIIVRSSAIGEDSIAASFAGQLDSIGDLSPGDRLQTAIL